MNDFLVKALESAPLTVFTAVAIIYVVKMMSKQFERMHGESKEVISANTEVLGGTKELIRENLDELRKSRESR